MKTPLTISQIKQKIKAQSLSTTEINKLREDSRKGVQKLIRQYDLSQQKKLKYKQQYEQMLWFENSNYSKGKRSVAGVDEAGRGPLAGPVVAGAVILPEHFYIEGLNDSKKLTQAKRETFFDKIVQETDYGIGIVSNKEIDQWNIYQATKVAMRRAINALSMEPDHLLLDAMRLDDLAITQESLVKGDQRSVSIAAASIVAKVTRDRMMTDLHHQYPMFSFNSNQGYGTQSHLEALELYGPSPCHRVSFAPVSKYIHS